MKKFFQEFKEFAMRGNVLDMAVGVVVGSAFTAIVTSIVQNLLTGQDLSAQLHAVSDLGRVLIPIHMLRNGENVFLDDYTVPRLSEELGCPVEVVGMDGFDLADAVFASCDTVKE